MTDETEIQETEIIQNNDSDVIEELPEMTIRENIDGNDSIIDEEQTEEEQQTEVELLSEEDCQRLYGVVLETAHMLYATTKNKPHRGIPEQRRIEQGKLLHRICEKYNIVLPAEFDIIILGAAAISDWQYMTAGEEPGQPDIRETGGVNTSIANKDLIEQ